MTALALVGHDDDGKSLKEMDRKELLECLSKFFGVTVYGLTMAADVVGEWKSRGWEFDDEFQGVVGAWLNRLRLIHSKRLLPELAVRFYGQPSVLDKFSRYDVDDQRLIANETPIKVLSATDGTNRAMMPFNILRFPDIAKQVFDKDHIRDLPEQAAYLEKEKRKVNKPRPDRVGKFSIDRARGGVTHRGEFLSLAELVAAVKELRKR